ncbi:hypothetical protein CIB48_g11112 [Xylaria polymorpha]|nr:hypothetical protein CIB48_g11112 [Xylaria polymorpha]
MAWHPSAAIFERFQSVNILNLLGLQAEIAQLEDKLIKATAADEADQPDRKQYQYDWSALQDSNSPQRQLIMDLRKALNEYKNPYGLASDLRGPGFRLWFSKQNGEYRLGDKLVLWEGSEGRDAFTQVLRKGLSTISCILPYFHLQTRSFPASKEVYTNASQDQDFQIFTTTGAIIRAGDKLVTVLSCLLITVPIVVLTYVSNTNRRLVLIILFTLAFSLAMSFVSDAKRKEIFAATAAFVAVQVVFAYGKRFSAYELWMVFDSQSKAHDNDGWYHFDCSLIQPRRDNPRVGESTFGYAKFCDSLRSIASASFDKALTSA